MEVLLKLFGTGNDLTVLQMCCRAVVVFFLTMWMIRLAGRRSFGMKSAFDSAISILLGAILSRAVVGSSPFIPTVCASFVLVILHRWAVRFSLAFPSLRRRVVGHKILLYENGRFFSEHMKYCLVSEDDIYEQVRKQLHSESLERVQAIYMEATGKMSFVKKE